MKFTVAAPLVALFTAYILALLALLAGIKPNFMPDAYIVRIALKDEDTSAPDDSTSTSSVPSGTATSNASTTSMATDLGTVNATATSTGASNTSAASSSAHNLVTTHSTSASASTRTASPTRISSMMDPPSPFREACQLGSSGKCVRPAKGQSVLPIEKRVAAAVDNDHVLIYARSDPKNQTSNETVNDDSFKTYTMHFLTNCQWSLDKKAEGCTKPWDFTGYALEGEVLDEDGGDDEKSDSRKDGQHAALLSLLSKRNAADDSEYEDETEKLARKLIHNRDAFSKVHLTGCVLVGVSFLCTAVSFFILPALGQWISVGNLALVTLATIFLVTSSIFTAVLATEMRNFHQDEKKPSGFTAERGQTLGALV